MRTKIHIGNNKAVDTFKSIKLTIAALSMLMLLAMQLRGDIEIACYGDVVDYNPSNSSPIGDSDSFQGAVYKNGTNCTLWQGTKCDRWWYDPPTTSLWQCTLSYEETGFVCHTVYRTRKRIGNNGTPWTQYNPSSGNCDYGCRDRYDYEVPGEPLLDGELDNQTGTGQTCRRP